MNLIGALSARLLRHPTAPYHEQAIQAEVEQICTEHGLAFERDQFGNLLVQLKTVAKQRPLVLAAHMDHPGFELVRRLADKRWLARFRGGVPEPYFRRGIPVRLMPGAIPARLGPRKDKQTKTYELHASRTPATAPEFAVWDLEDFSVRQQRIHARACDDLIGVASVLATFIELKRSRAKVHVIGALTRAEEVGFHGALALAAGGAPAKGRPAGNSSLPSNSLIISLETSRELPGVRMGQGVILRVGDRASIFDSEATRFLAEAAADLKAKRKAFQFQRALMGGGTCEATAYQEFGHQAAAVCIALGNYHNCGERNRIQAEYVSLGDVGSMVELLVAAAKAMRRYPVLVGRLPKRLRRLLGEAQRELRPGPKRSAPDGDRRSKGR